MSVAKAELASKAIEQDSVRSYGDDGSQVAFRNAVQLIAFSIGEQSYAVEITTVREIRAWNGATALPNTADFVRGVINLRGVIVPIIDLRARFGMGLTEPTKTHVVVVLAIGSRWIGILVDAVSDILTIAADDINSVPDAKDPDKALVGGLVMHEEKMVSLINLNAISSGAVLG
jgi:purine-binding chemotaxis protein CheW